ncbi:MAG: histone deacetylase family protein [Alphaproteobacteria bacterium]|nr:histone deacetylase family protein [Alphaproteobacteria bacterium]
MATMLVHHNACLAHDPGAYHPESPKRYQAVMTALSAKAFDPLVRREAPAADRDVLALVHPARFIDQVLAAVPKKGAVALDADTVLSPGSGEAALRAAGAVVAAVDAVMAGEATNAFCAVRPPGHHAEPTRAMGFCLFNSVAVGARAVRARHRLTRVAVVDFDVHHGNGTQAVAWDDEHFFYASTHQFPLYPGTGSREERGVADNIVNVPLRPGSGSREFRSRVSGELLPALERFAPEFLFISAGFDAHREDPLAHLQLEDGDYAWITTELAKVARQCCAGRIVAALEGGYNLDALGRSVAAHVEALMAAT